MQPRNMWCLALVAVTAMLPQASPGFAEIRGETPVPSVGSNVPSEPTRAAESPAIRSGGSPVAPLPLGFAPALATFAECFNYDTNGAVNSGARFIPPNPYCAVGPDQAIVIGSCTLQIGDVDGIGGPADWWWFQSSLRSFFDAGLNPPAPNPVPGSTLGTYCFDPKVIYDQYAERFVVIALERWDIANGDASDQSRILVAVSKTSDPHDGWWYHAIDSKINISGSDGWADYPGLAVDDKAIYITNNMFEFQGAGGAFLGVRLWIINKTPTYSGPDNNISFIVRNPYLFAGVASTTQPAHMFGTLPTGSGGRPIGTFLVAYSGLTDNTDEYLQFVEVTDPLAMEGGPFFTVQQLNVGNIEEPAIAMPDASQLGSPFPIETNDRRMLNAVWRANNLYCTATIRPTAGADAGQATVRWWRLNTTVTTALTQADAGNVGAEDLGFATHTFNPQVMVDGDGNMAIGFASSGSSIYPGAYYTTRLVTDPAGTVSSTAALTAGTDYYKRYFGGTSNRWGDYSGLALSPVGESDFWVFNEYAGPRGTPGNGSEGPEDGRWYTRIGKFRVRVPTSIEEPSAQTSLSQNNPNPFNPSTMIRFTLAEQGHVALTVYDANGQLVRTLVDGVKGSGSHDVTWDGRDNHGASVGSGVYFYRYTAGKFNESKKMVLLK